MKRILFFLGIGAIMLSGCEQADKPLPVFTAATEGEIVAEASGGVYYLAYNIENPAENGEVKAASDAGWIGEYDYSAERTVSFNVAANETAEMREADIVVTYTYAEGEQSFSVKVRQNADMTSKYPDAFSFGTPTVTVSSAEMTVNNNYPGQLAWTSQLIAAEEFESLGGAENMEEYFLDWLQSVAAENGNQSVADFLPGFLYDGASENCLWEGLTAGSAYVPYAVGVDYKGNILTGFHVSEAFYTYSDMSFDITVTPDIETASATIAPSKDDRYLATCIEAEFYNAGMGDDELIDMLLDMFKDNLEANTYSGARTISFSELDPGTDYFVVAFGVNTETGDNTTELFSEPFTTLEKPASQAYATASVDNYWLISDLAEYDSRYAQYLGGEPLFAALDIEYNDSADGSYFVIWIGDLSGDDREELINSTLSQGTIHYKGDPSRLMFMSYDTSYTITIVAFDDEGSTGDLFVELVELDEAGTSDDFALFDEYFDSYMGSKSFVKCINAGI